MKKIFVYKIRRNVDGKFSTGGSVPRFTSKGKLWASEGHVSSHVKGMYYKNNYKDCEVIKYELQVVESAPVIVKFFDTFLKG